MKTGQRSDEADCGGVGVLGDVGTEADDVGAGATASGSVSAMLRKVILCGGSLSSGTGWPFRVPEVDVRTGRIPGDLRVYTVFLGCRRAHTHARTRQEDTLKLLLELFLSVLMVFLSLMYSTLGNFVV